jgi:periplasmic copper chaperone A
MTRNRTVVVATTIAALALPAAAQAHVTLQPNTAPAGAFMKLDVRVPTERDDASTSKVDVRFPAGFASARYQAVPGWKVRVVMKKLATPIQTDDGPITEGVDRMTFTRTSRSGGIKPGQFQDFPISVQIPGKAGDKLTFKALQTYSNGEIVRWIGAPDADSPAPQVTVTAAAAQGAAASAGTHAGMGAGAASAGHDGGANQAAATTSDDGSNGLSIAALAIGVLGFLFGGGALLANRRRDDRGRRSTPATA